MKKNFRKILDKKLCFQFSLDFSNLNKNISAIGIHNYSLNLPSTKSIGFNTNLSFNSNHYVVMIHQWWGLNFSICLTAKQFCQKHKIQVLVPDLYKGKNAIDHQEAGHLMTGLNWTAAISQLNELSDYLKEKNRKVFLMGFCMGGALTIATLASSKSHQWNAGSTFYGIPDLNTFKIQNINVPFIGHFGKNDPLQNFSDIKAAKKLQEQAKKYGKNYKDYIYQDCSHAFCNQDSRYYNKIQANIAYERTNQFFQKYIAQNN